MDRGDDERRGGIKRRQAEPSEESSSEGSDSSSEWEVDAEEWVKKTGEPVEEIMTDFEAHPIAESDFVPIRRMMTSFCGKQSFDSGDFVDVLLAQDFVGSVIRQADTSYTVGFISVVSVNEHKDKQCFTQIKQHVLATCPKQERQKWETLVHADKLGLLVNDRLHNIPHAIAPLLHETTCQEIQDAIREGHSQFRLDQILYITSFHTPDKGISDKVPKKKKTKGEERTYWKAEDKIFEKNATLSYTYQISGTETKLYLVFPAASYPTIVTQIKALVEEGYSW